MHLDGRYSIIFNGEIYNHTDVRNQLGLTGHTSSDTETLLLLYRKYGPGFLNYLDGMFAFAIYDRQEKTIFLARDRAGKKPLYYYADSEKIVFASELNCIKGLLPLQMDQDNFYHYLRLGSFYKTCTPYKNVGELPAGSFMLINCATLEIKEERWWDIHDFYRQSGQDNFEESLAKVDAFLHAGVKRRVESSDLEVGSFLSGGIDSGLTTAIASAYNNSLKTFTVSFDGEYDEAPLAKLVADKYQTHHTEIKISFDTLKDDLETIIGNYGEPFFDSSAIPSYYVSAAAKKHVTVILNGDGADELFGGYRRYVPFAQYDFFKANPLVKNAAAFLKSLLLAEDDELAARQRTEIAARLGEDSANYAIRIHQQLVADLHPMLRLPLAAVAFPVLRLRPRPELDAFMDSVFAVVNADGEVSLFEYCLGRLLTVQVRESLDPSRYARFGRRKPGSVRQEFATLLAVVAHAGHEDASSAQRAYLAGMQRVLPRDHLPYAPPANGVLVLDAVWEPLDALDPLAKQVMVEAVTAAASHDGRISVAEAELLRTICGALHCPLPPMLERG